MKPGDYLIAKEDFSRIIFYVTRDNTTGLVLEVKEGNNAKFTKNTKYEITKIFKDQPSKIDVIEIKINDDYINFSLNETKSTYFEYYKDLFSDILITRKEKLNNIYKSQKPELIFTEIFPEKNFWNSLLNKLFKYIE